MPVKVIVAPEAAALLEVRKRWWRQNRPATADLFDSEFLESVALIAEKPTLFSVFTRSGTRQIRRILMEKTACHLYYEVDQVAGAVTIISAWGATQGKPPLARKST